MISSKIIEERGKLMKEYATCLVEHTKAFQELNELLPSVDLINGVIPEHVLTIDYLDKCEKAIANERVYSLKLREAIQNLQETYK